MFPQQPKTSYEGQLSSYLYGGSQEKTFVDKVLAKDEVAEIKELMQKASLTREELLKLLYLIAGTENKLLNFGEWDRYLLGKFFAWIRDFVSDAEILFDYLDKVNLGKIRITLNAKEALLYSERLLLHDIKFVIDVYCFLGRSTLSLGATAFDTLTSNRFEYDYKNYPALAQTPENKGFKISFGGRK